MWGDGGGAVTLVTRYYNQHPCGKGT